MKLGISIAAALLCVAAIPSQTVTHYWVDAVAGNDSSPGTRAQPFKSLTWAVGFQFQDSHVHVMPGVYSPATTGDFADPSSGQPAQIRLASYQNLKITGVDKATCILDFGGGNGPWGFISIVSGCVDIEISDLTMRNSGVDPWGNGAISVDHGAQSVDIHNCYFEQTYSTLILWGGYDVAFHDNVITDATPNTGNWPSVGVRVRTDVTKGDRSYIYNNTFYAIGHGISWSNDANNPQQWIMNNVCRDVTAKAYPNGAYAGSHIVFENNLAYNSGTWNYDPVIGPNGSAPMLSATNLEVDPMLTNPAAGDYSLAAGSPCIEGGSAMVHPYQMNDYAGNNRAVDSDEDGVAVPDMGAIETTDLTLGVSNFAQGQTMTIDIQVANPGNWIGGALFFAFAENPTYNPMWGMFGPDLNALITNPSTPIPLQLQMLVPVNAALNDLWIYTEVIGLKIIGSTVVLKGTGMTKSLL